MSTNNEEYIVDTKYLKISYSAIGFTLVGGFLLFLAWGLFLNQWLGNTTVGSPLAKSDFTAKYWVFIQPDNTEAKNYRVKADISRDDTGYSLDKVYWPNGGSSTFDDCYLEVKDSKYVSEYRCISNEGLDENGDNRQYDVTLDTKVE